MLEHLVSAHPNTDLQIEQNPTGPIPSVEAGAPIPLEWEALNLPGSPLEQSAVAISGLRRKWAEVRLERAEEKAKELAERAEVYKVSAANMLIDGRRKDEDPEAEAQHAASDKSIRAQYQSTYRPITRHERKYARKAERLMRKNMEEAVANTITEMAYGRQGVEFGSDEHKGILSSERLTKSERHHAMRAIEVHHKYNEELDERVHKVQEGAVGEDRKGRRLTKRIGKYNRRQQKLSRKLGLPEN